MQTRILGSTDITLSAIGYGGMSFADFYGETTDSNSHAILSECLELGITHIDTSNVYGMGRSETVIGEFLKDRGGENPFVIATKGGITSDPDRRINNDPAQLESALNESLARLGIDCIDLYYVHRLDSSYPIEDVTHTLSGFVKSGKIKHIGFSEIAPSSLRRAHSVHPITAIQSEYSLSVRYPELGLVQTCAELGVSLVAFSPVARSLLTNKPHNLEKIQDMPFLASNPRFTEPNLTANHAYNAEFCALASDLGVAASTLACSWLLSRGDHVLPIPGTRSIDHLRELAASSDLSLSSSDISKIDEVLPVGWAHGDRYSATQWLGPERYC